MADQTSTPSTSTSTSDSAKEPTAKKSASKSTAKKTSSNKAAAKIVGLLILALFGAYHRTQLMPRLEAGGDPVPLRRSVRKEIAIMILVVMLGGFLAYVPVPHTSGAQMNSPSSQER